MTPTTPTDGAAKFSENPVEVIPGMRVWRNPNNGFVIALLHYSADPDSASEAARRAGMSDEQFRREHDLDFSSWAGKPVFQGFTDSHIDGSLFVAEKVPVWRSWDFGYHHPAVVYSQVHGEWWVLGELLGEDMTLDQFVTRVVQPYEARVFGEDVKFIDCADPAGKQVSDKSEHTSFAILSNYGIFPYARKSEINEGLTLIRQKLTDKTLKVHPRCRILIEGFKGGYRYPEPTTGTPEPLFPLKDGFFDHVFDTLRYTAVHALNLRPPRPKKQEEEPSFVERVMKGLAKRQNDPDLGDLYF